MLRFKYSGRQLMLSFSKHTFDYFPAKAYDYKNSLYHTLLYT